MDLANKGFSKDAMDTALRALHAKEGEIQDICVLKKGMTNQSVSFLCRGERYIMRIPGEGTHALINRWQEAEAYAAIEGKGICDAPVWIDPGSGYKITRHLGDVRTCNPADRKELRQCMKVLSGFHAMGLSVRHTFDLYSQIDYYESLWQGRPSRHKDYARTKERILALRPYIDKHKAPYCLSHMDAVPDNFLFYRDGSGMERIQLIDWEYAGMQDPHVDIAMFSVYAMFDKGQIDHAVDLYFQEASAGPPGCPQSIRVKIYCYIAVCGLLWSNWCEYKSMLGVRFGIYEERQYAYAKDFAKIALAIINENGE